MMKCKVKVDQGGNSGKYLGYINFGLQKSGRTSQMNKEFKVPQELTEGGIRKLAEGGPHPKDYILQVINLSDDYEGDTLCSLSDGHAYLKGKLKQAALRKANSGELGLYDIIRFTQQDINIFNIHDPVPFRLNNFQIIKIRMLNSVGVSLPYMTYFHNNYINEKGNSSLKSGLNAQTVDIQTLVENYPNVPSKWVLRAKVVKKPEKIYQEKKFMIIELLDTKQQTIEGVFFGFVAMRYHKQLICNKEYLFTNGIVQKKKNRDNCFEIKFNENSHILPIQSVRSNFNEPVVSKDQINAKDAIDLPNGQFVNINARVLRIQQKKIGRILTVIDSLDDSIEILLWDDIRDEVKKDHTYIFFNLRVKHYNQLVSLQSTRNKTEIRHSFKRIGGARSGQQIQQVRNLYKHEKMKQAPAVEKIKSVKEMTTMNIQQKVYVDVHGFLIINGSLEELDNFFKLQCQSCTDKDVYVNPLRCKKCSSTKNLVKWNVRSRLMDEKQEVKCIINQQLCQKLFGWSATEALNMFLTTPEEFQAQLEKISFREGIFKIKINPFKNIVFYNILEMYKEDSKALLQKTFSDLKKTMKLYEKIKKK